MDLLSNLASKALQDTNAFPTSGDLRPRLVSQFEPTSGPILPVSTDVPEDGVVATFHEANRIQAAMSQNRPPTRTPDRPMVEDLMPIGDESPSRHAPTPTRPHPQGMTPLKETDTQRMMNQAQSTSGAQDGSSHSAKIQTTDSSPLQSSETREIHMTEMHPMIRIQPATQEGSSYSAKIQATDSSLLRSSETRETHMTEMHPMLRIQPAIPDQALNGDDPRQLTKEPAFSTQLQITHHQRENEVRQEAGVLSSPKSIAERIEVNLEELSPLAARHLPALVPAVKQTVSKSQTTLPESETQMPTINVTIGRVEVKAVTQNPPSRSRAVASSTMSLDEYLRRRKGSNR